MKKDFLLVLVVLIFMFATMNVYATSVTTDDGVNINVTNDKGENYTSTMSQIDFQVRQADAIHHNDSVRNVVSGQSALELHGVQDLANQALANYQIAHPNTDTSTSTETGT